MRCVRLPRGAAWISNSLSSGSASFASRTSHSPPPNSVWNTVRKFSRTLPNDSRNIDRKSTRLNSSHGYISYAVFCLKKKKTTQLTDRSHHINLHSDNHPCTPSKSIYTTPLHRCQPIIYKELSYTR